MTMLRQWEGRTALVVAFLVGGSLPVVAQETLFLGDVARLRGVVSAVIAPGGEAVAFVRIVPRVPLTDEDGAGPGPPARRDPRRTRTLVRDR